MKKIILLFTFSWMHQYASAQWNQIHPNSDFQKTFIKAFVTPGNQDYLAVYNTMARSTDKGNTWANTPNFTPPIALSLDARYQDIQFCNERIGIILSNNSIFHTSDGGATWQQRVELKAAHSKLAYNYFSAVHFHDTLNGYAVGAFNKIFKTADGGQNWDTVSWVNQTAPFVDLSDVFFLDDQVGFIAGYEVDDIGMNFGFTHFMLKTLDGGQTWNRFIIPTNFDYRHVFVQPLNKDTIFAQLSFSQYHEETYITTDGGQTWSRNSPPLESFRTIEWIDSEIGLAFGRNGFGANQFLRTEDGGANWDTVALPFTRSLDANAITDIAFADKDSGFAVGSGGLLMTTNDKGKTWIIKNNSYPYFYNMDFGSDKVGYASSGTGFYKTTDGGFSWNHHAGSDSMLIMKIDFENEQNGLLYGFKFFNYQVKNGGDTIERLNMPAPFVFETYIIARKDSLFVTGTSVAPDFLTFLRSPDRGRTWEKYSAHQSSTSAVSFHYTGNNKFYIGTPEIFKRSLDGGVSWDDAYTFDTSYLKTTCLLATDTLLAYMTGNSILRTTDGGTNWQLASKLDDKISLNGLHSVNSKLVYAYGTVKDDKTEKAAIWRSDDLGTTWREEGLPPGLDISINSVSIGDTFIYASSGYGQVLRCKITQPVTTTVEPENPLNKEGIVYPVPATDILFFTNKHNTKPTAVNFITLQGAIASAPFTWDGSRVMIDVSSLPLGPAILQLHIGDKTYRKTFVKY